MTLTRSTLDSDTIPPDPDPLAHRPYLRNSEPLEPDELPLQVALLTMEAASLREAIARIEALLNDDRAGDRRHP
jgi:hypothetical protein